MLGRWGTDLKTGNEDFQRDRGIHLCRGQDWGDEDQGRERPPRASKVMVMVIALVVSICVLAYAISLHFHDNLFKYLVIAPVYRAGN